MDSYNPEIRGRSSAIDSGDWRTQISAHIRRCNARLLIGELKKLLIADQERLERATQFVLRAEEGAFKAAIGKDDYCRRITQMVLDIRTKSQNLVGNFCNKSRTNMDPVQFPVSSTSQRPISSAVGPGPDSSSGFVAVDSGDWRTHLEPGFRRDNLRRIMEELTSHFPGVCNEARLIAFKRFALKIEASFYGSANSRSDYLRRVSEMMPAMLSKARNFACNPVDKGPVLPLNDKAGVGNTSSDQKHLQPLPRIDVANLGVEMGGGTLSDIVSGSRKQINKYQCETSVQKHQLSLDGNLQHNKAQQPIARVQQLVPSQQSVTRQDQPLERLVQALSSVSPKALSSSVIKIGLVIGTGDCIEDKSAISFGKKFKRPLIEMPLEEQFKRRRTTESNDILLKEINKVNAQLIDTAVEISKQGAQHEGTIVYCCFRAVSFSQNLKSLYESAPFQPIRLLIPKDYPNHSPMWLDDFSVEASSGFCHEPFVKAQSRFRVALRILSEPISIAEIARTWDLCAREAIFELAQQHGGGSFSNKYGVWESCSTAGSRTCLVGI